MKFKTLDEIYFSIWSSLPPGKLFSNAKNKDTIIGQITLTIAKCFGLIQAKLNELYNELSIRLATNSLEEWETFLGIYRTCSVLTIGTVEQRRQRLISKLSASNPQTTLDFVTLIQNLGYTARLQPAHSPVSPMTFPMTFPIYLEGTEVQRKFTIVIHLTPQQFAQDNSFLLCSLYQYLPANVNVVLYSTPTNISVNQTGLLSFPVPN